MDAQGRDADGRGAARGSSASSSRDGRQQVRLTGGEPLLRRASSTSSPASPRSSRDRKIAMTTNGVGLERVAERLPTAGLDRVNVSLDTSTRDLHAADPPRPARDVEQGSKAAADAGLTPVKVNAVAMRGINDETVADLLAWCLERGYELRFIEQMPLDAQHAWDRGDDGLRRRDPGAAVGAVQLTPLPAAERGSAPAERFLVDGGPATVGIIASVSAPFCCACDRTRLTADGQVRNCLFPGPRPTCAGRCARAHRRGAARSHRGEMWRKRRGHGIGDPGFVQPDRPMSAIGG